MADLRDVLAGQIVISDQVPSPEDLTGDPLVVDLDAHQYNGTAFIPRHYVRYPMVNEAVPAMAEVAMVASFASSVLIHGRKVIFVSLHPAPRAMCAARALHLTIGGTIQGAIMAVNKADDRTFANDQVLDVIVALGGGAR